MKFKKYALVLSLLCLCLLTVIATTACNDTPDCTHDSCEWVVDTAATCSTEGAKHKVCLTCEETVETATIAKTAHTEEKLTGRAPTCELAGLTDGRKCSVCDTVILAQQEIPQLDHVEEVIERQDATCTVAGHTASKVCSVCDTVLVEPTLLPAGHTPSDWIIDTPATLGVAGHKHTECMTCGTPLSESDIPALSEHHTHQANSWIVVTPATCAATGVKNLICACGYVMATDSIATLSHTEEKLLGIAATCTTTGLTEGKKCSACGETLVAQSTIAIASHTEITVLGTTATCTAAGLSDGKKCAVCNHTTVSQLQIPPKGHTFDKGTCTTCGMAEPYGIWIVDGNGNPISDVFVKIKKNGEQVKMYPYRGVFLTFDLPTDSYDIELDLSLLDLSYTFDLSQCKVSPEKKSTTVRLYRQTPETSEVFVGAPLSKDYTAYHVSVGSYQVNLTPNDYTFFIFAPTTAAIYTITYECDSNLTVGYHGSTFFVQGVDLTEDSEGLARYENGLSLSVYSSNLGGNFVIGIQSASAESCILNIKNAGDPGTRLSDQPWTPYLEDQAVVNAQLSAPQVGTYTTVDLTDLTLRAVYNESDGYYHLGSADGAILFIDLTTDTQYVSSIQTIGVNQRIGRYIYDVNGVIIEKRSYNELFCQYGIGATKEEEVTESIRVPLTAKLAEAIQSLGEKQSWWAEGSDANIFTAVLLGAPYNQEFAWLLYCGYYA